MPTPEDLARENIDALLDRCGWVVQDKSAANLSAGRGVAVRELSFKTGEPDYTLFVDGKAIGTVEAKLEGHSLTGVEEQSEKYVKGVPFGMPAWRSPLPFSYESTGTETRFTNRLDPVPRSRNVFAFHWPDTLLKWAQADKQLNQGLRELPPLVTDKLWKAQIEAITNLEQSFAANKPRALIQMATGSGKTFTAVNFSYRLIKNAGARRVLFLVDRGNLGEQTFKEFDQFESPVNNFRFTQEFIVQHLKHNTLDDSARVVISTVQRLYSMLKGEAEPPPDLDDLGIDAGFYVDKRDRQTRKKRWEQLDDDLHYDAGQLDREVVSESQIRTVLQTFREKLLSEMFPGRADVPKTLIFAKDDSHADDIVRICREVFDKGNDFCQKITYKTTGTDPKTLIQRFRNSYNPRIAVTVDMIATGTDVKPLEVVFFMRSVKSRGFFEQMKGRGVRVISETEMEQVNPGVKRKSRFVIVDAVGVCERDMTDSCPLEKKRNVTFDKLLDAIALGNREPEALESLAGRLVRLEHRFDEALAGEVRNTAKGQTLLAIAQALLEAVNPDKVEEASRLLALEQQRRDAAATLNYFDPNDPVAFLSGDLPHWRQDGATYFVTFRLADSLPQEKLAEWRKERDQWLGQHPEPHDEAARKEYYERFPQRLQQWLDAGTGSCVLAIPEVKELMENALRHFDAERYQLDEFVVASNHVHALISPLGEHQLSEILHSWKSFSAHEILKVEAASRRLSEARRQSRDGSATLKSQSEQSGKESGGDVPPPSERRHTVWQRESFDHIVRSPASMEKFREYIRAHRRADSSSYLEPTEKQRRDAAATLMQEAVAPLTSNPPLRQLLIKIHQASEQVIDVISRDRVLFAGASQQTTQNAEQVTKSFRDYIEQHKAEITALQLLYSRPYRHRLTESMLKELEKKLREEHAAWTEDRLWDAFAAVAPKKVKGRSQAGRFADLVALVRFVLEREQVLQPFAQTVNQRFSEWIAKKQSGSGVPPLGSDQEQRRDAFATFTPEQRAWLELIRDHIATAISIEPNDFNYAPFSQRGGLGKAHQLFPELPKLLDELNEALAA